MNFRFQQQRLMRLAVPRLETPVARLEARAEPEPELEREPDVFFIGEFGASAEEVIDAFLEGRRCDDAVASALVAVERPGVLPDDFCRDGTEGMDGESLLVALSGHPVLVCTTLDLYLCDADFRRITDFNERGEDPMSIDDGGEDQRGIADFNEGGEDPLVEVRAPRG